MAATVAQEQIVLHLRPAQVEKAILQAHRLGQMLVVRLKRRRQRRVENFDLGCEHLDFAAHEIRIDRTLRTLAHAADHLEHVFVTQLVGNRERLWRIGIAHDLYEPFAVPEVDENRAPMVASAVKAVQGNVFPRCSRLTRPQYSLRMADAVSVGRGRSLGVRKSAPAPRHSARASARVAQRGGVPPD